MIVNLPDHMIKERIDKLEKTIKKIGLDNPHIDTDKMFDLYIGYTDILIESDQDRSEKRTAIYGCFESRNNPEYTGNYDGYRHCLIGVYEINSDLIVDYAILNSWIAKKQDTYKAMEMLRNNKARF